MLHWLAICNFPKKLNEGVKKCLYKVGLLNLVSSDFQNVFWVGGGWIIRNDDSKIRLIQKSGTSFGEAGGQIAPPLPLISKKGKIFLIIQPKNIYRLIIRQIIQIGHNRLPKLLEAPQYSYSICGASSRNNVKLLQSTEK